MITKTIKKVLLFIPPAYTFADAIDINPLPPLGLGYLGAILEKNGIETKIVDCLIEGWSDRKRIDDNIIRIGLSFKDIEDIIKRFEPDIVGVNNLFTKQRENAHKIYEIAKKVNREIITIAGGAHPTVMPELVLSDINVDYAVLGEGEESLMELIEYAEGRRDASSLDGVCFRENGKVRIIPKRRFITDLDALPFPARNLLKMEKYFGIRQSHGERRLKRFSPIITSRGCAALCTFWSAHRVWGRKFRARSPENVIAEMKHLKDRFCIEELIFEDDNITLDPKRAEAIFDLMIKEKLDLKWDTPNGVAAWTLNEKLIDKMKESGCYKINFAFESGNQYVLDNIIKKPLRIDKVKPLVKYAKSIGLEVGIFLVVGMPSETIDQIWDSFYLAKELEIYTPFISVATPYPGTELFEISKKKGYLKDDFSLDDLYIRSFSISTETFDSFRLRKTLKEGQSFLIFSYIMRHPLHFIKRIFFKVLLHPLDYVKRLCTYLKEINLKRVAIH